MTTLYKLFLPIVILALVACGDSSDDNDPGNITEVARDAGTFTTLLAALEATGLDAVLADESSTFTVFAPTDAAFAKLGQASIDALLADPDRLSDILLYHVVAGNEINSTAATAAAGTTLETANGDDVGVALNGADLLINASVVVTPDVDANNGIIHAIDTVLIPTVDNPASGNIAEVASSAGVFTTLLNALAATGLDTTLSDANGKFTVFAPTDDAFAKLGDISGLTTDELTDILLYHVVPDREINASALTAIAGNTIATGNSDPLALSLGGMDLFANLSTVSTADVDASNGIIHIIDTVLLPPADAAAPTFNIVETAIAAGNFTTLVTALQATGLDSTLADPNAEFTVFAPTDDAFNLLGTDTINNLLMDTDTLSEILTKHVLSGAVDSISAFTLNGTDVPTVNGETVAVDIMPDEFFVDDSKVRAIDKGR
ncbi:MAG: fasciclin domain-containing protein [Pseudomonadota bacterium]